VHGINGSAIILCDIHVVVGHYHLHITAVEDTSGLDGDHARLRRVKTPAAEDR
jgi:hypothetical protein